MSLFPKFSLIDSITRCYKALLIFYPAQFRREFQREMLLVFRESCRTTLKQRGNLALLRLCVFVGYDLLLTSSLERYHAWISLLKHLFNQEKELSMLSPLFQFTVAARTDIGCVRENNEDSLLSVIPEDAQILQERGALFVVADGLGGHDRGAVASNLAVNTLRDAYYRDLEDDLDVTLKRSVLLANQALLREVNRSADNKPMGTTCIAAVLHGNVLYIANVGDSRAYVLHHGAIRQISQDHSVVAEELRKGTITEEEARTHPKRNVIYRSLGYNGILDVDLFTEQVEEGDLLFLCTDGVTELIFTDEICSVLMSYNPEECVEHLIALAKERGAPDNVTALVVHIGHL